MNATITDTYSSTRRRQSNEVHLGPLIKWLMLALFICASGLMYVYVKNQQHAIGEQTRQVERQIKEIKAQNEVLIARISMLSSRAALQHKMEQGMIALEPIQDHSIARLTPPTPAEEDGVLRTATAANRRAVP